MSETKRSSDAVEWAYNHYIKGDPEMEKYFEKHGIQSELAQQIYDIRKKLNMTREQLGEFSGLSPETNEDLEETDYNGDWVNFREHSSWWVNSESVEEVVRECYRTGCSDETGRVLSKGYERLISTLARFSSSRFSGKGS